MKDEDFFQLMGSVDFKWINAPGSSTWNATPSVVNNISIMGCKLDLWALPHKTPHPSVFLSDDL